MARKGEVSLRTARVAKYRVASTFAHYVEPHSLEGGEYLTAGQFSGQPFPLWQQRQPLSTQRDIPGWRP